MNLGILARLVALAVAVLVGFSACAGPAASRPRHEATATVVGAASSQVTLARFLSQKGCIPYDKIAVQAHPGQITVVHMGQIVGVGIGWSVPEEGQDPSRPGWLGGTPYLFPPRSSNPAILQPLTVCSKGFPMFGLEVVIMPMRALGPGMTHLTLVPDPNFKFLNNDQLTLENRSLLPVDFTVEVVR